MPSHSGRIPGIREARKRLIDEFHEFDNDEVIKRSETRRILETIKEFAMSTRNVEFEVYSER